MIKDKALILLWNWKDKTLCICRLRPESVAYLQWRVGLYIGDLTKKGRFKLTVFQKKIYFEVEVSAAVVVVESTDLLEK